MIIPQLELGPPVRNITIIRPPRGTVQRMISEISLSKTAKTMHSIFPLPKLKLLLSQFYKITKAKSN